MLINYTNLTEDARWKWHLKDDSGNKLIEYFNNIVSFIAVSGCAIVSK